MRSLDRGRRLPQRINPQPEVDQARRVKAALACMSLLRVMHDAVQWYEGDLEAFVIYMAVACASIDGATRGPQAPLRVAGEAPADRHFRPVSRRAIAASTGLPRETVRRKISLMIERGYLVQEPRGVRARPGVLLERRNSEFTASLIKEIERSSAELARVDRALEAAH
jgi:hypothetical protein